MILAPILLAVVALMFAALSIIQLKEHEKSQKKAYDLIGELNLKWIEERQQLLDRIQAPSFDHLKQAEIRKIKAEKEEPAERVELL